MITSRARDGGRTQSGCVKGMISLEHGPEPEPEPGPELSWLSLRLIRMRTIFLELCHCLCGLDATCACFIFLSLSPSMIQSAFFVCIVHMSVWQFVFLSFVASRFNHDPAVLSGLSILPLPPSPQSPQTLCPFFLPTSSQIHAQHSFPSFCLLIGVYAKKCIVCEVCCRVVSGSGLAGPVEE